MQVEPWRVSATLKRTRSPSPASSKRRVPDSYYPAILAQGPSQHFRRAATLQSYPSAPPSPRDWVSLTEGLHLATPPADSPHPSGEDYEDDTDMAMSQEDAVMHAESPPPPHFMQQLAALPSASFHHHPTQFDQSFSASHQEPPPPVPPSSPVPPHRLPPLHLNLAGSPVPTSPTASSVTMARSVSGGSTDSSMSTGFTDPRPRGHMAASGTSPRRGTPFFTMGYRADCEKCVARVPGHYSHFGSEPLHAPQAQVRYSSF